MTSKEFTLRMNLSVSVPFGDKALWEELEDDPSAERWLRDHKYYLECSLREWLYEHLDELEKKAYEATKPKETTVSQ